jgi:hypothetical protein
MNNGHINLAKSKAFIYISTDFEGQIVFENRAARIYFNHISATRIQEISKEPLKDVINKASEEMGEGVQFYMIAKGKEGCEITFIFECIAHEHGFYFIGMFSIDKQEFDELKYSMLKQIAVEIRFLISHKVNAKAANIGGLAELLLQIENDEVKEIAKMLKEQYKGLDAELINLINFVKHD